MRECFEGQDWLFWTECNMHASVGVQIVRVPVVASNTQIPRAIVSFSFDGLPRAFVLGASLLHNH